MTSAEELYQVAKSSIPSWMFGPDELAQLRAAAEVLGTVWDHVKARIASTYVLGATSEWLEVHASDRGTRRQGTEGDASLQDRIRFAEDAVTPIALLAQVNRVLAAAGIAGAAHILELRQKRRLYLHSAGSSLSRGLSRGWRLSATGPAGNKIIIVLPYGTTAAAQAAATEAVRRYRAGGVGVIVEVRGVP